MKRFCAAILLLACNFAGTSAVAELRKIAAVVEDISGSANGLQPMELLEEGRVFKLGEGVTLTLGYLRSCIRETITGGTVTVGREESKVDKGVRQVEEVDCDGGVIINPSKRGDELAGAVFRRGNSRSRNLPNPEWITYGTNPVFRFSKPGERVRIERLDKEKKSPIDLAVEGLSVDLLKIGVQLDPGGLYEISNRTETYVVKISPLAVPEAPLLSRLILMLKPEPPRQ